MKPQEAPLSATAAAMLRAGLESAKRGEITPNRRDADGELKRALELHSLVFAYQERTKGVPVVVLRQITLEVQAALSRYESTL